MYIFKKLLRKNPFKIFGFFLFVYFLQAIITQSKPAVYNEKFNVESVSYMGNKIIVSDGIDTKIFDKNQPIINNVIYYKSYDLLGIVILFTTTLFIILVTSFISTDKNLNWGLSDIKINIIKNRIELIKVDNYFYYVDTETDKLIYKTTYSGDEIPYYTLEEYINNPEMFFLFTTPDKKRNKSIDSILN